MSEASRGNRKLILILSALLAWVQAAPRRRRTMSSGGTRPRQRLPRHPPAFDWGDPDGEGAGRSGLCALAGALPLSCGTSEPPAADRPRAAQPPLPLRGCDAEALYYGIGVRRDPARARACAFTQAPSQSLTLEPFSGRAMLMTIYANGAGSAPRHGCRHRSRLRILPGSRRPNMTARVTHSPRLRGAAAGAGRDFHYCDDISGGLAEGPVLGAPGGPGPAAARGGVAGADRAVDGRGAGGVRAASPRLRGVRRGLRGWRSGLFALWASLRSRLEQGLRDQFADMLQRLSAGSRAALHSGPVRDRGPAAEPGLSAPGSRTSASLRRAGHVEWLEPAERAARLAALPRRLPGLRAGSNIQAWRARAWPPGSRGTGLEIIPGSLNLLSL